MRLVSIFAKPLATFPFVGLKIAVAPVDVAIPLERQDMRCQTVEKPAVVAHHDRTAGKIGDRLFQCPQRIDVDVVGRFVQQQHVRSASQQFGQGAPDSAPRRRGPRLFSAGRSREIEPRDVGSADSCVARPFRSCRVRQRFLRRPCCRRRGRRGIGRRNPIRPSRRC